MSHPDWTQFRIVVSSVRYANACGLASDEGSRRTAQRDMVESTGPTVSYDEIDKAIQSLL